MVTALRSHLGTMHGGEEVTASQALQAGSRSLAHADRPLCAHSWAACAAPRRASPHHQPLHT